MIMEMGMTSPGNPILQRWISKVIIQKPKNKTTAKTEKDFLFDAISCICAEAPFVYETNGAFLLREKKGVTF